MRNLSIIYHPEMLGNVNMPDEASWEEQGGPRSAFNSQSGEMIKSPHFWLKIMPQSSWID